MTALYFVRFFSYLALACVLPFYSIWLRDTGLFSIAAIATLVAALIIANRLTSFFIAPFIGNFHKKHILQCMIAIGIINALLISWLAQAQINTLPLWLILSIVFGGVFSVITLSILTLISNNLTQQFTSFNILNIALNLSAGLGPFLSGFVISYYPKYFTWLPVLCLGIAGVFSFLLPLDINKQRTPARAKMRSLLRVGSRPMLVLLSLNFLIFIAYAQFYETFPFHAKEFISAQWIGGLFLLGGLFIAIIQMPMSYWMRRHPLAAIITCHIAFLLGLLLLPMVESVRYDALILGVALISVAEVIFIPVYRTLAVKLGEEGHPEIALAKLNLMWGSGNSLAAFIGLYWVGHGQVILAYGLGVAALLLGIILILANRTIFSEESIR